MRWFPPSFAPEALVAWTRNRLAPRLRPGGHSQQFRRKIRDPPFEAPELSPCHAELAFHRSTGYQGMFDYLDSELNTGPATSVATRFSDPCQDDASRQGTSRVNSMQPMDLSADAARWRAVTEHRDSGRCQCLCGEQDRPGRSLPPRRAGRRHTVGLSLGGREKKEASGPRVAGQRSRGPRH